MREPTSTGFKTLDSGAKSFTTRWQSQKKLKRKKFEMMSFDGE
jgi:hypothetical protein